MVSLIKIFIMVFVIVFVTTGCGKRGFDDLKDFVTSVHKDRKPRVEPLPRIRPRELFVYTASQLTDPFLSDNLGKRRPTPTSGPAPDLTRRKEPLEQYPLDSLSMVGTLSRGESSWAVIRAPDGTIHRAQRGNYLGQNYGKIDVVADNKLFITELVTGDGGNWVKRENNLAIVE